MAGLFAVQLLGINIQPLLAVGGASSLLIGLATQTLLTNAVMGVSIFLARPFVPGVCVCIVHGCLLVSLQYSGCFCQHF
jgi:small-conductance mechanosensitive channel